MTKIYIFILCVLISISARSQNKTFVEVKYTQITDFFKPFSTSYVLKFNSNNSFYKEVNITKTSDKNLNESSENSLSKNIMVGRKNLKSKWLYKDSDTIYFRDNYYNKILLLKDDKIKLNWKFIDEVKEIGGYLCQKAEVKFRGRVYYAWYTKQIPYAYGPWKFNGLPGLILQINEKDNVFYIKANNIKIIRNTKSTDLEFDKSLLKNLLSIKQYNQEKIKLIKAIFAEISSKQPKGTKPIIFNEDCDDCRYEIEYFDKD